jgi:hypothetical protein
VPFLITALLAIGLCAWIGRLGEAGTTTLVVATVVLANGGLVLLLMALWASSLLALLLLPRSLPFHHSAAWIVALAALCRVLLLTHPIAGDGNRYLTELGSTLVTSSPLAVKLVMICCDLATLVLVLQLLRQRRLEPRWALLHALNPVVLYSFAGTGHLAAPPVLLITGALLLYQKRRWPAMFMLLGLAAGVGYPVFLLTWPLFLRGDNLRQAWMTPVSALGPVLAALLTGGLAPDRADLGPDQPLVMICLVLLVPVCAVACWLNHPQRRGSRAQDPVNGLLAVLGAWLLLAPAEPIWSLAIMVPFLAIRPMMSWLVLSGTSALSLLGTGHQHLSGQLVDPGWLTAAVWLVPLILLARELQLAVSRNRSEGPWSEPRTVSVVIPARNEAEHLGSCLAALGLSSCVTEVIVVDGGSSDATRQVAGLAGARVIEHTAPITAGGGRGGQIKAGCRRAHGDVVAVVHADSRLAPGALDRALETLARNPDTAGATLGARLDGPGPRLRFLEVFNDLRAALLGISFGDQVQLFRRQPLLARDLYPGVPLMEDIELSLRLHRLGRVLFLWQRNLVSARRWQSGSRWKTVLVNRLVAEYLLRRLWGAPDTVAMYRRYYDQPGGAGTK